MMDEVTDQHLIAQFLRGERDEAFRALVARHSALVYRCARRIVGDHDTAQDVAQAAFLLLLRKAPALKNHTSIAGWLYQSTVFIARDMIKRTQRREAREREAADRDPGESSWPELEATLDSGMARLSETDRHILLLRYFENRSLRDVGTALGLHEDTAQKRVSRALDRLRRILLAHGAVLPASTLATFLSLHAAPAAPAATQAMLGAIVPSSLSSTLAAGEILNATLKTLLMKKLAVAATTISLLLLVSGTGYYISKEKSGSAAPPPASTASPMEQLQSLAQSIRDHDGVAIAAMVHVTDSDHQGLLQSLTGYITAMGTFNRACREAFGDTATDSALWNRSPQVLQKIDFGQDNLATANLQTSGNEARVNIHRNANVWEYIRFQRVKGTWMIHEEALDDLMSSADAQRLSQIAPVLNALAQRVKEGAFSSAPTAMDELIKCLRATDPTI